MYPLQLNGAYAALLGRSRLMLLALTLIVLLSSCGQVMPPVATRSTTPATQVSPAPAATMAPTPTAVSPTVIPTPTLSVEAAIFATMVAMPTPTTVAASPQALAYLTEVLDYMQEHALMRDQVDWPALRREALRLAGGAQMPADTYRAIRFAIARLGDRHSHFLEPEAIKLSEEAAVTDPQPEGRRLEGGIGYLTLPEHRTTGERHDQYATTAQDAIRAIDRAGTCGWVVDLRHNRGGNMWPMLAGVGPILGEGNVGSFVDARGQRSTWAYRNGQALLDGVPRAQVDGPAYQLQHALPPVALLTDKLTASSGEAIVVAFRGRPNTRSFGAPTGGVPTANDGKQLSDGAILWLTVAWDADRTGRIYDDRIVPDEPVVDNWSVHGTDQDPVLQAALIWLRGQPSCRGQE